MDKKKGTHIAKRLLAAVCTAALVLGLVPGNLGTMSVQASGNDHCIFNFKSSFSEDSDNPTELPTGDTIGNITDNYIYLKVVNSKDDLSEVSSVGVNQNGGHVQIESEYSNVTTTLTADKWEAYFDRGASIVYMWPAADTKTATTTTLSADSITVNYGDTWTLIAQAKADGTNIDGATVVYYSNGDCTEKIDKPTSIGRYFARGEYAGNDTYAESRSEVITVDIEVNEVTPIEPKDNVAKVGDSDNSGTLTVESAIDSSAPATTVATKASDILSILEKDGTLTAAEIADISEGNSDVEVILGVMNNKDSISTASKDLIKEKADAEGMTVAEYMDITLTKYIIPTGKTLAEASATQNITELKSGSIAVTVTIPEAFKNTDSSKTRTYYVLRNHDGVVDVLDGALSSDGLSYTFTTDRFSDYVLTYKDTTKTADTIMTTSTSAATTAATTAAATSPKTGERMPIAWMFVLLLCGAAGVYGCSEVLFRKKR